ncbi:MAG: hypothetical protein ACFFB5_10115 [Promethearchaeota archaeon]
MPKQWYSICWGVYEMASVKKIIIVVIITSIVIIGGVIGINLVRMTTDVDSPRLISVEYNPNLKVNTSTTIQIFVEDISGIESCKIYYSMNGSAWVSRELRHYIIICCPPRYLIRLRPFRSTGIQWDFYFEIIDKKNNILISEIYSFIIVDS